MLEHCPLRLPELTGTELFTKCIVVIDRSAAFGCILQAGRNHLKWTVLQLVRNYYRPHIRNIQCIIRAVCKEIILCLCSGERC